MIPSIPNGLEINDATDKARIASYFDLHLEIDSEGSNPFRKKLYDKRCDLNLPMVNFLYM